MIQGSSPDCKSARVLLVKLRFFFFHGSFAERALNGGYGNAPEIYLCIILYAEFIGDIGKIDLPAKTGVSRGLLKCNLLAFLRSMKSPQNLSQPHYYNNQDFDFF